MDMSVSIQYGYIKNKHAKGESDESYRDKECAGSYWPLFTGI